MVAVDRASGREWSLGQVRRYAVDEVSRADPTLLPNAQHAAAFPPFYSPAKVGFGFDPSVSASKLFANKT